MPSEQSDRSARPSKGRAAAQPPPADAPRWCACGYKRSLAERARTPLSLLTPDVAGGDNLRGVERDPIQIFMLRRARALRRSQHASAIAAARLAHDTDVCSTSGSQVHVAKHRGATPHTSSWRAGVAKPFEMSERCPDGPDGASQR